MSVWDKIDFDEFTGEDQPVDPKLKKLLRRSHEQMVQLESIKGIGGKTGGKNGGKTNVESGHMERIQKIGCSLGGKKSGKELGKNNVESGHIYDIQGKGGEEAQKVVRTCPHCGLSQKGSLYFRNHGDRCKLKNFDKNSFINKVKEGRSIYSLSQEYGLSRGYVRKLIDSFK